jgi:hypothetical protein
MRPGMIRSRNAEKANGSPPVIFTSHGSWRVWKNARNFSTSSGEGWPWRVFGDWMQ